MTTTSKRLRLERPTLNDFQRYYEINAAPEAHQYNPNGPMDYAKANSAFADILQQWQQNGFGVWKVLEKENPDFVIGFGGISERMYGTGLRLNLGYRFDKGYWGKGYATELAKKAIDFAFNKLQKETLFAIVRPQNLASIHVLEKCMLIQIDTLEDFPGHQPSLIYHLEKENMKEMSCQFHQNPCLIDLS